MRLFPIDTARVAANSFSFPCMLILGLLVVPSLAAQREQPSPAPEPDVFASAMSSFLSAHQDAMASGDADRILKTSAPVAVASLALLVSADPEDQEKRKAADALDYAAGLLSDLPTELMVLRMELSLNEAAHATVLKSHILTAYSDTAELHAQLAQILEQDSQFEEAIHEARRAVELDSKSRDAYITLGMAYWGLNVFQYNEETLRAFSAAHRLDPDSYATNLLLGSIESQYHHFDAAAQSLRAAIAANASAPEPWYQLGMNAFEQANETEAARSLHHFISLVQAGKNGKPAQMRLALLILDQIAEEQGTAPESSHRAEEDALKQQQLQTIGVPGTEAAASLAMGSPDTSSRSTMPDKRAAAEMSSGDTAQLREQAAEALGNIGTVLARRNDFAAAVVAFKYAAAERPDLEQLVRNLGLAACISGAYQDGEEALRRIVEDHPADTTARGCLGMAETETGDVSDAVANFDSLGAALSSNPMFSATAATAFARTGDAARAAQTLAELRNAGPDPQLEAREAAAWLDLGDTERASDLAQAALNSTSENQAEALRVLGLLDLERGDPSKAAIEFESESHSRREGTEDHFESQALLAEALIVGGRRSEGENLSFKLVQADPDLARSLFRDGKLLRKNQDSQAAFEKLAAACALAPRDKDVLAAFDAVRRELHIRAQ